MEAGFLKAVVLFVMVAAMRHGMACGGRGRPQSRSGWH